MKLLRLGLVVRVMEVYNVRVGDRHEQLDLLALNIEDLLRHLGIVDTLDRDVSLPLFVKRLDYRAEGPAPKRLDWAITGPWASSLNQSHSFF